MTFFVRGGSSVYSKVRRFSDDVEEIAYERVRITREQPGGVRSYAQELRRQ